MTPVRTVAVAVLVAVLLGGCASLWERPLVVAAVGQGADVASTAVAICADNLVESNPAFTLAGDDCWQVVGSAVLLKSGLLLGLWVACKPSECPAAWRILGGVGFGAATWNSYTMSKTDD